MKRLCTAALLLIVLAPQCVAQREPIHAELGKESAWTGEAVPLIVTLYSPGPFNGTASFDLPRLPRTAIVKLGNPVVGSEQVDEESFLTQRHEFAVYTQSTGEVVIPAFAVRFEAKSSFTSDAEAVEGAAEELRFRSNRPPGTESLGVVIAVADMQLTQSWAPSSDAVVSPGEVIKRTISRRASGTTAMMFPRLDADAPHGVRVYTDDPIVQDNTVRGASTAARTETITYQFERPGTFQLPDQTIAWWDTAAGELKRETLAGETVTIEAVAADDQTAGHAGGDHAAGESVPQWMLAALFLASGLGAILAVTGLMRWSEIWRGHRNRPEGVAARRLLAACRVGAAPDAYAALLAWKRAVADEAASGGNDYELAARPPTGSLTDSFQQESSALARRMFGKGPSESNWSGDRLATLFKQVRRHNKIEREPTAVSSLPTLNPPEPIGRAKGVRYE